MTDGGGELIMYIYIYIYVYIYIYIYTFLIQKDKSIFRFSEYILFTLDKGFYIILNSEWRGT